MDKLISLCMIVKNEEKVLARCLDSVQGLVDEIIIVDTGSTDTTKEIAAQYTKHVFEFVWIKDFAAARNESIRRATSKWILVLDADEYVERNDIPLLRDFLLNQDVSGRTLVNISVINYMGSNLIRSNAVESLASRIFSAHQGIYYTQPIHEQLTIDKGTLRPINFKFRVYHTGYTDETRMLKNKSERNLEILNKIKETRAFRAEDYFALANEYAALMEYDKAIDYYKLVLEQIEPTADWYKLCLYKMIDSLLMLRNYQEAFKLIEEGINKWINYPDFFCLKANVLNQLGFFDEAKGLFEHAMRIANENGKKDLNFWLISPDYGYTIPIQRIADYYYRKQDIQQTILYLIQIVSSNPKQIESLMKLIAMLSQTNDTSSTTTVLHSLYPNQSLSDLTILFNISLNIGDLNLSEYYLKAIRDSSKDISSKDMLRYSVLSNNQELFNQFPKSMTDISEFDSPNTIPFFLAALLWKQTTYVPPIPEDNDLYFVRQLITTTISGDVSPITPSDEEIRLLFELFTEMFTYKLYNTYDQLLQRIDSSKLINLLADYFYRNNFLDLAIDYYSILLDANELQAQGYVNLTFLHFNLDEVEKGSAFLQMAIELKPDEVSLYTIYCTYSKDRSMIEVYKNKLFEKFPQYKEMQIFIEL